VAIEVIEDKSISKPLYLILGSQGFLCFPSCRELKTHEKVGNNTITLRLGKFLENGPGFQGYTFRRFLYFETQKDSTDKFLPKSLIEEASWSEFGSKYQFDWEQAHLHL